VLLACGTTASEDPSGTVTTMGAPALEGTEPIPSASTPTATHSTPVGYTWGPSGLVPSFVGQRVEDLPTDVPWRVTQQDGQSLTVPADLVCGRHDLIVANGIVTAETIEGAQDAGCSTLLAQAEQQAAKSALLRLARFRAADAPPVEGVFVKRATLREFNEANGDTGTDLGVADTPGYFVAVDGAFQVTPPGGESTATAFSHAYILMGPGGDELAVHVTDEPIDLTGFARVPG
jgi:hypothetical protein